MRKQRFCMMGIVMALAVMIAPPLIGAQAHAAYTPVQMDFHLDKAPATLFSVQAVPAQVAAPGPTKASTAERLLMAAPLIAISLLVIGVFGALGYANRPRRYRPRSEVAAGVGSSGRTLYLGG